jgi:uncharacterized protein (DUF983 family)
MKTGRLSAVLRQRCPVCLEGPMYSGLFRMYERCPECSHQFEREPGFFQGAMYVSWVSGVGLFAALALLAQAGLAPRIGLVPGLTIAIVVYLLAVPQLFRYSRVIWAHVNIGTRDLP